MKVVTVKRSRECRSRSLGLWGYALHVPLSRDDLHLFTFYLFLSFFLSFQFYFKPKFLFLTFSCCYCFWARLLCQFNADFPCSRVRAVQVIPRPFRRASRVPPIVRTAGQTKASEQHCPDQNLYFKALIIVS